MKKIMNKPQDSVTQLLNGIAFAHDDCLKRIPQTGIMLSQHIEPNKVAVISGGGTGHEPAHSGYVGKNMLAASINGPIFTPPEATEIFEAIKQADQGNGVFMIVKNFEADVANFLAASALAKADGHQVAHVIVNDDCSIEKSNFKKRRRGVAGTVFVHKIVGAAAANGLDLASLTTLATEVVASMNTLGVALAPGTVPGSSVPQFSLDVSDISFGIGIHGEAGYRTEPLESSEKLANELVNKLKIHYRCYPGMKMAIMVNGLGSTPLLELYVFANDVRRLLALEEIEVSFKKVGNFMTSTNMSGVSLTFLELKEPSWLAYLKEPVLTYAW